MSEARAFVAKREDGKAEWQVVYETIRDHEPGDIVTYETLMQALEVRDKRAIYPAMGRAVRKLRADRKRSAEVVRNVGYRVLKANEHRRQSDLYMDAARKRVETGVEVLAATRIEELTPHERRLHQSAILIVTGLQTQLDHTQSRVARIEEALGLNDESEA